MSLRVFAPPGEVLRRGDDLVLEPDESHYLVRVRRARPGDTLEVLDANGGRWGATLTASTSGSATLRLDEPIASAVLVRTVTLLLACPEPKAMLDAITSACAGGATSVVLVHTERGHAQLPAASRLARVIRATMRQCGRPTLLPVSGPIDLDDALMVDAGVPGVVARPGAEPGPAVLEPALRLLVGAEGGFSPSEDARIDAAGFVPMSLGPWTLRTEMAVAAALSRVLAP